MSEERNMNADAEADRLENSTMTPPNDETRKVARELAGRIENKVNFGDDTVRLEIYALIEIALSQQIAAARLAEARSALRFYNEHINFRGYMRDRIKILEVEAAK